MKEHPILFTGAMVRAILEGRKTQTRRPIKAPKGLTLGRSGSELTAFDDEGGPSRVEIKRPFAVGDRLWVRETWCQAAHPMTERPIEGKAHYAADGYEVHNVDGLERSPWRPSIHMPRWASRITLEVTAIRPERVRSIGIDDTRAEGVTAWHPESARSRESAFRDVWDKVYGKGPFAWQHNPWTWAVTFKVVTP